MPLKIVTSNRKDKRYKAIFMDNNQNVLQTTHFGSKNGQTYIDHSDENKRRNYIKRHQALKNENWNGLNAGSLSRYILWGDSDEIEENIKNYKRRFNISTELMK
jgi:hypothetical protein